MTPMKLLILSDLHLEFSNLSFADTEADVIILAGDIANSDHGIHWARTVWPTKEIIYVAGNHEFYGYNRLEVLARLRIASRETGVHFLDNEEVVINGVRFLGATLWTNFKLFGEDIYMDCMLEGESNLNDFRVIKEGERNFSALDSINLHNASVAWLTKAIREPFDEKTVVVTHHLPSADSVVARFKKDLLSACFASKLDHLMGKPVLWVHGHTHDNLDYEIRSTRVVCNPRGYCRYEGDNENFDFNQNFIVDLDNLHKEAEVITDTNPNQDLIDALLGLEKETSDGLEYYDICFLPPELITAYWKERNGSTQPSIKGAITPVFAWDFEPWRDRMLAQLLIYIKQVKR
jgi:predicted phosphodiesterase